jgi:hypothetical protein
VEIEVISVSACYTLQRLLLFKMFFELLHYYFMTQSQWVHYFMVPSNRVPSGAFIFFRSGVAVAASQVVAAVAVKGAAVAEAPAVVLAAAASVKGAAVAKAAAAPLEGAAVTEAAAVVLAAAASVFGFVAAVALAAAIYEAAAVGPGS